MKLIAILLISIFSIGISGCGNNGGDKVAKKEKEPAVQEPVKPATPTPWKIVLTDVGGNIQVTNEGGDNAIVEAMKNPFS